MISIIGTQVLAEKNEETPKSCEWMLGIHRLHFGPSDHERPIVPVMNALNLILLKY